MCPNKYMGKSRYSSYEDILDRAKKKTIPPPETPRYPEFFGLSFLCFRDRLVWKLKWPSWLPVCVDKMEKEVLTNSLPDIDEVSAIGARVVQVRVERKFTSG